MNTPVGLPMNEQDDARYEAAARYLAGEADGAEARRIASDLDQDPALRRLVERLRASESSAASSDIDVESALTSVRARMRSDTTSTGVISLDDVRARRGSMRIPRRSMLAAAATLLVVVGSIAVWNARKDGRVETYATATGETKHIVLADGTAVDIAPLSTLRAPRSFGRSRNVELEGLARFTVTHDATRPFVVHAGNAAIEDIGTVFSVRTEEAGRVAVAVTAGSVKLRSVRTRDAGVLLKPGDSGVVADAAAEARPGAATAADNAWVAGHLTFENAGMDRVRSDLRRWYGVNVVVGDSVVASRHLTATFDNEPIDQVIRIMGLALDAQVVRRGDTVFIARR